MCILNFSSKQNCSSLKGTFIKTKLLLPLLSKQIFFIKSAIYRFAFPIVCLIEMSLPLQLIQMLSPPPPPPQPYQQTLHVFLHTFHFWLLCVCLVWHMSSSLVVVVVVVVVTCLIVSDKQKNRPKKERDCQCLAWWPSMPSTLPSTSAAAAAAAVVRYLAINLHCQLCSARSIDVAVFCLLFLLIDTANLTLAQSLSLPLCLFLVP